MQSVKVVHLTSAHPAFDTRILHRQCTTLAQQPGYRVVLVVPHERAQQVKGVEIRALPLPKGRLRRMMITPWQVLKVALSEKGDVYHFHDPELIPIGLILKLLGKTVISDVHEDVAGDILRKEWIHPALRGIVARVVEGLESFGARCFDRIITATHSIARKFPPGKTRVVQNFPGINELEGGPSIPYQSRPPVIFYVGDITKIRGIREMVEAVGLMPAERNIRFLLAGRFSPPSLADEVRQLPGWERVEFVGWTSREELTDCLGKSRLGLVLFHPGPNHTESQPNKLFEFMAAGIPVVASDFPRWREIVGQSGSGLHVDPLNPQAIADAILWVLDHPSEAESMGVNGRLAVTSQFNWEREAAVLLQTYQELTQCKSQQL